MNENEPHIQVEWDPDYYGGDYGGVGSFTYIPVTDLDSLDEDTICEAFEEEEGVDRQRIIHYSTDELYTAAGDPYEEEDEEWEEPDEEEELDISSEAFYNTIRLLAIHDGTMAVLDIPGVWEHVQEYYNNDAIKVLRGEMEL